MLVSCHKPSTIISFGYSRRWSALPINPPTAISCSGLLGLTLRAAQPVYRSNRSEIPWQNEKFTFPGHNFQCRCIDESFRGCVLLTKFKSIQLQLTGNCKNSLKDLTGSISKAFARICFLHMKTLNKLGHEAIFANNGLSVFEKYLQITTKNSSSKLSHCRTNTCQTQFNKQFSQKDELIHVNRAA